MRRTQDNNIALDSCTFFVDSFNRSHFVDGLLFQIYNIQLITIIVAAWMRFDLLTIEYWVYFIVFPLNVFSLVLYRRWNILFVLNHWKKAKRMTDFPIDCVFDTLYSLLLQELKGAIQ